MIANRFADRLVVILHWAEDDERRETAEKCIYFEMNYYLDDSFELILVGYTDRQD